MLKSKSLILAFTLSLGLLSTTISAFAKENGFAIFADKSGRMFGAFGNTPTASYDQSLSKCKKYSKSPQSCSFEHYTTSRYIIILRLVEAGKFIAHPIAIGSHKSINKALADAENKIIDDEDGKYDLLDASDFHTYTVIDLQNRKEQRFYDDAGRKLNNGVDYKF